MSDHQEFEHYRFIADKGQNPLRIDRFLLNFIEFATRNKIQQSIKAGNVRVNNKIVKANYKVKAKDIVTIVLNYPKQEYELIPEDIYTKYVCIQFHASDLPKGRGGSPIQNQIVES